MSNKDFESDYKFYITLL